MKKWLVAVLMITMLIIAGCSNDSGGGVSTENSTIQKVLKEKKLIIGMSSGYFPFDMKNPDGDFVGYDVDFANALGEALGVKVEYKQFTFDGLIPALQTGEVDMIFAGMTITGSRALAVSFADPYFQTGQAVMVPGDDTQTKTWQELDVKGTKIAVGIGTTGALLAKDVFKNAEIMDFEDFPAAAAAMAQGQAAAVVYDEPAIAVWKLRNGDAVNQLEGLISTENLGIAIKKNDFETIQWVNSFLSSYLGSPSELASRAKWFESSEWLDEVVEE
ncbi:amino acid ABC transporter substrate-binding protein, PAAT family [Paenisporosarcina quisquiliarum]|uniref:transporter substrate-binding domain-containing protein n=1 Tax=Psychrobacillus psychrodurans TaxID=126157 RepID=UPI0008C8FAA6|nr:transporter substrate-binding domain-containing protein [Psychrobacillus psychrodurans]MCK1995763.1 transporter substrate-binding domain-containing protein [Psychrobacillus psychrodurans]MCZ8539026.1 transporter substrate-binding domain-containing protein [Psychrobacillus psychrodurans]SEM89754.1 amino acid ABC transporter substrate-binding protein, PAAT family [Paenisporosarcina quisquiliarum]SFM27153.1 polar amino acid transport system substrate-binding protein [Psychrobacillus psychrodura